MTYDDYTAKVKTLLDNSARQKCYNDTGTDGPNQLFDFIYEITEMGHALGEIIYKVIRYNAKKNPEDLEKISAWAYLVWRKHHESGMSDTSRSGGQEARTRGDEAPSVYDLMHGRL